MSRESTFSLQVGERVRKVSAYASAMVSKYLSARQKLAILEPLLGDDIARVFDNSYGAHAFKTLRLTLTLDLIRDIWAFTMDSGSRAPSLKNIWSLIETKELSAALRDTAIQPYDARDSLSEDEWTPEEIAHWRDLWSAKDKMNQGASFDRSFEKVSAVLPKFFASERATRVELARKKTIAHYDMKITKEGPKLHPLSEIGLKWDDPRLLLEELDPILWDVVLIATWGSYDREGYEYRNRLYAADFWARLQRKPPIYDIE
ncbi:MAG TPA: hypothetical protein VHV26_18400 [Rhizomicrobium sp.]|jgi:hypothetical protein|nr:hypothetical protein [Rhizomicrobium sp.]